MKEFSKTQTDFKIKVGNEFLAKLYWFPNLYSEIQLGEHYVFKRVKRELTFNFAKHILDKKEINTNKSNDEKLGDYMIDCELFVFTKSELIEFLNDNKCSTHTTQN